MKHRVQIFRALWHGSYGVLIKVTRHHMAKLLWHQCICAKEFLGLGQPRHREVEGNEL